MTLKELLGTNYKDGMTVAEADEVLKTANKKRRIRKGYAVF